MTYASTYFLLSLADLKEYLGLTDTSQDSIVGLILDAVCQQFNEYTGRTLAQNALTEYYDGCDDDAVLQLRSYPVASSPTIQIYDDVDNVFGADTLIDSTAIRVNNLTGQVRLIGDVLSDGFQNIKVVYTAGWAIGSVPSDLRLAACEMCGFFWQRALKKDWSLSSVSLGNASISIQENEMPRSVKLILDRYRRMA
jgi:uncharacterized phiE125 gp8 family phage protein